MSGSDLFFEINYHISGIHSSNTHFYIIMKLNNVQILTDIVAETKSLVSGSEKAIRWYIR